MIPIIYSYTKAIILSFFVTVPILLAMIYLALGTQNLVVGKQEKSRLKTNSGGLAIIIAIGVTAVTYMAWVYLWKPYFFWPI